MAETASRAAFALVDLAIDYGYNGCSGVLPENCEPGKPVRIIPLDRHTPTDYISMATDPNLFLATRAAMQEMVDFLAVEKHLTRHEAYKPNVGVHVRLPKSIFVAS